MRGPGRDDRLDLPPFRPLWIGTTKFQESPMPRMTRMLPVLALLPLLAACEELNTVAVEQPAPVFPAPEP